MMPTWLIGITQRGGHGHITMESPDKTPDEVIERVLQAWPDDDPPLREDITVTAFNRAMRRKRGAAHRSRSSG